MYIIYDNNRKAQYPEVAVSKTWDRATWDTFEEALEYTKNWLGPHVDILPEDWDGKPIVYGHGDTIEIRKEDDPPENLIQAVILYLYYLRTKSPALDSQFKTFCKSHGIDPESIEQSCRRLFITY